MAHHAHMAGRIREGEFLGARVDPILEDFANWLKRKIFLNDDPVSEVKRLIGDSANWNKESQKRKSKKRMT